MAVGEFYERLEKFQEALEIYTAASTKVEHMRVPIKAIIYGEMGFCYYGLNMDAEALKSFEAAFSVQEIVLGKRHTKTLHTLYWMIHMNICCLDNLPEAVRLSEKMCLGQDLVPELDIEQNLNIQRWRKGAYRGLDDHDRAIHMDKCLQTTLEKYHKSHEKDDPPSAKVACNVGDAYYGLADYNKALEFFQLALDLNMKSDRPKHKKTLRYQEWIARSHFALGQYNEAEELLKELLIKRTNTQSRNNSEIIQTEWVLGWTRYAMGNFNAALDSFQVVLESRQASNGIDGVSSLKAKRDLAEAYIGLGRCDDVKALFEELLIRQSSVLGQDHPDTIWTEDALDSLDFDDDPVYHGVFF